MDSFQKKTPIIAITGGKGGTGKTLIATNLAIMLAKNGKMVLLIDCDVENPNTNILLGKSLEDTDVILNPVSMFIPRIDHNLCSKCGKCREACYRHAILKFPQKFPSIMEHLCSGCETCMKICPDHAIFPHTRPIGVQYFASNVTPNLDLLIGELNPSEAVSILIVKQILLESQKIRTMNQYDIIVIDTSPGAHCDVEQALSEANMIICVTEPTPFGEHDLTRILDLVRLIHGQASIILNRANMADYRNPIFTLAENYKCSILGEIPLDDIVIEDYAKGVPFITDSREFPAKTSFIQIFQNIMGKLKEEIL